MKFFREYVECYFYIISSQLFFLLDYYISTVVLAELDLNFWELSVGLLKLLLEKTDVADAAKDWIVYAEISLVHERPHSFCPLVRLDFVEDLGHIALSEHAVHVEEPLEVVRREIWCEDAVGVALAAQVSAGRAWREFHWCALVKEIEGREISIFVIKNK